MGVGKISPKKKDSLIMFNDPMIGFGAVASDGSALPPVAWGLLVPHTGAYSGGERARFIAEVSAVSRRLDINPNWLYFTMYRESSFLPYAKNPNSSASGLIQFMESTAKRLGTTTAAIRAMTPTEQLKYVELYYKPYRGKMKSFFDLYLATFYPAAIGKPLSYKLGPSPAVQSRIARVNSAYDLNKDKVITVGEIARLFDRYWRHGVVLTKGK